MPNSQVKNLAKAYSVSPMKALGQNFLTDNNIIDNILLSAGLKSGTHVLEIGPGLGNMTKALLSFRAVKAVTVVEFDKRCIEALEALQASLPEPHKLTIIQGDALHFKEEDLDTPLSIVSNLPYNIGTKLLLKWLDKLPLFTNMTLMLQKEVVERIIATPSTSAYGRLSIMIQLRCHVEKVLDVPPEAFWPAPAVESAVVRITPRGQLAYECDMKQLEFLCKAAFMQRRKFLLNNLKPLFGTKIGQIFTDLNIHPKSRAEELSIEQFCLLSKLIA